VAWLSLTADANGKTLKLGSLKQPFKTQGAVKLPVTFSDADAAKVRAAKSFSVSFSISGTPSLRSRLLKAGDQEAEGRQADGLVPIRRGADRDLLEMWSRGRAPRFVIPG
jgi:hypothetical protein